VDWSTSSSFPGSSQLHREVALPYQSGFGYGNEGNGAGLLYEQINVIEFDKRHELQLLPIFGHVSFSRCDTTQKSMQCNLSSTGTIGRLFLIFTDNPYRKSCWQ
jgi:hypothetical protein